MPDREKLVAEISKGGEMWAEINQDAGEFKIELYARRDGSPWVFPLDDLLKAIERAQKRLLGELP
jgi:hypothetical protein